MKQKFYFLITCAAVALNIACGSAATSTETTKTNAPANTAPANQPKPEAAKTETKAATLKQSTPSEAGESFFNAMKNKDVATFKQLMSKDSMEILEAAASEKKMTLDDLLTKQFFPNTPMPDKWEQRNEKITGDKATVEIKDEKGAFTPLTFVKEGSAWKVSLE